MQEIKKRLILKEDLNLDVSGNDEKVFFGDNNNLRQGKKINAGDIPLKQETRKKLAAVDVNTAIELIADKVENITASAVLEQDETIEFANNDSLSDIQLKINAQIKNLNGHTLTFKFPANLSQLLYSSIVFQDFYNGTVVVTSGEVENKIAVYDQLNINSLFRIYRCQCEVVIRNFYIVHQYSPFGISVESSSSVIIEDCNFSGINGGDSYAVNKSAANVILKNCNLGGDVEIYPPAEKQDQGIGKSIGEMFAYPASMPPEGAYLLNGQTIAHCRDLYPKFWEWVNSAGVRVIDDTTYESELASAGVCSGFVLDSAFGGVRLPKWKYQAPFGETIPVRGNGISLGLSTGSVLGGLAAISGNYAGHSMIVESAYGAQVGQTVSADYVRGSNLAMGVTTDSDKSGIVAENNAPTDHFVWCIQVYNAATALSEQDSAQLASEMQLKAQTDFGNVAENLDFVVESWKAADGFGWYRKYRSGWVEQGGIVPDLGDVQQTVNFYVEMADTKYTPSVAHSSPGSGTMTSRCSSCYNRTVTTMDIFLIHSSDEGTNWQVQGYAATK